MSYYGNNTKIKKSFNEIKSIINKVFKKYKNEIFEYGLEYNSDLKKTDLKISDDSIHYTENRVDFMIDLGDNFDGWLDCYIRLDKKESDVGYFDYTFSD